MAGRQCAHGSQSACRRELRCVMVMNLRSLQSSVTKFWNSNEPRVCSYIHIRISRSIISAVKRPSKKDYNDSIKYGKIEYACIHEGKNLNTISTGERPNQK